MPKKLKFKPVITKVKLNPEQAVLSCCAQPSRGVRGAGNWQCVWEPPDCGLSSQYASS